MLLRTLGLNVQELETGPYVFLLSHSLPVAYRDRSPGAMPPGLYKTDRFFSKSVTRHVNKWVSDKGPHSTVPHDHIVSMFRSVSRYTDQPATTWAPPY
jgi:hypothetical protein